jgi:hypothetical protein
MTAFCERISEPPGFVKGGGYIDQLKDYPFAKKEKFPAVKCFISLLQIIMITFHLGRGKHAVGKEAIFVVIQET